MLRKSPPCLCEQRRLHLREYHFFEMRIGMRYHLAAEHAIFWRKITFHVHKAAYFVRIPLRVEQSDKPSRAAADQEETVKTQMSHKAFNHFHNGVNIQRMVLIVRRIAATRVVCGDQTKWLKFGN